MANNLRNNSNDKFKIESYDAQPHNTHYPANIYQLFLSFFKGGFVHIFILAIIIFLNASPTFIEQQPLVETSLIHQNELVSIQSQIKASRSEASKKDKHNPKAAAVTSSNNSSIKQSNVLNAKAPKIDPVDEPSKVNDVNMNDTSKITPSKEALERDRMIAERNKEFEQALEKFTQEEEAKIKQRRQQKLDAQNLEMQKQKKLIQIYKEAENEVDNIVKKNRESLQKALDENKKRNSKSETNKNFDLSQGIVAVDSFSSYDSRDIGANKSQTTNINLAASKIQRHLNAPMNSGKDYSSVRISVNEQGDVIRVVASGSNEDLNKAVEQAVRDASPLPISLGDRYYPSFSMKFEGKGNQ